MKKALSLILAIVLCLGLCACGNNNESKNEELKIKEALISGVWNSDTVRRNTNQCEHERWYDYKIYFYEDGSFKRTNLYRSEDNVHNRYRGPEEESFYGTWTIDGNTVITTAYGNETQYTFSYEGASGKYLLVQVVAMASDFKGITYYSSAEPTIE